MFMRMGGWRARSRLVSLWFDVGALVALACSMLATALLSLLLYNTLMRKPIKQQVLVPVVCSTTYNMFVRTVCVSYAVSAISL